MKQVRVRPEDGYLYKTHNMKVRKSGIVIPSTNGIITNDRGYSQHSADNNEYVAVIVSVEPEITRSIQMAKSRVLETDHIVMGDKSSVIVERTGKTPFKAGDKVIVSANALKGDKFEDGSLMVDVDLILAKQGADGKTEPLFDMMICEMHVYGSHLGKNTLKIAERISVVKALPKDRTWFSPSEPLEEYDIIFHGMFEPFKSFDDKVYVSVMVEDVYAKIGFTNKSSHDARINEWYNMFKPPVRNGLADRT